MSTDAFGVPFPPSDEKRCKEIAESTGEQCAKYRSGKSDYCPYHSQFYEDDDDFVVEDHESDPEEEEEESPRVSHCHKRKNTVINSDGDDEGKDKILLEARVRHLEEKIKLFENTILFLSNGLGLKQINT